MSVKNGASPNSFFESFSNQNKDYDNQFFFLGLSTKDFESFSNQNKDYDYD